jgi:threonine 3-dehydrogenase
MLTRFQDAWGNYERGYASMATLITGGAGFIGLEVVRLLVENGESRPVIFSRNPVREHLGDLADRVDIIRGDLGNFSHVLHAVKQARPQEIYHLGAMLSVPSEADPAAAFQTNAAGTFYVLEAARLFEVPRVIFASTGATYGLDIADDMIRDTTIQRPQLFYGATKVFGEHMGLFYRRKYQLDFRGLRYPSIIGPGVRTPGVAQYTSWVIEECAKGKPFTIWVTPETRVPVMYIKDAARATVQLAAAPWEQIKTVTYLIDGQKPTPSAQDLADAVRAKLPEAQITFRPDLEIQRVLDRVLPLDDRNARQEWGWEPTYTLERMVEDFLGELRTHPRRYSA